jgi:hypothetical protein
VVDTPLVPKKSVNTAGNGDLSLSHSPIRNNMQGDPGLVIFVYDMYIVATPLRPVGPQYCLALSLHDQKFF